MNNEETGETDERDNFEKWSDTEGQCSQAAQYIGENLKRWGRVNVTQYKSKWNTVRVYCSFGFYELIHGLFYPGYHYVQYPKWVHSFDFFLAEWVSPVVNFFMIPYQKWLYKHLYRKAFKKWPLLQERLIGFADYSELLKDILDVSTGND